MVILKQLVTSESIKMIRHLKLISFLALILMILHPKLTYAGNGNGDEHEPQLELNPDVRLSITENPLYSSLFKSEENEEFEFSIEFESIDIGDFSIFGYNLGLHFIDFNYEYDSDEIPTLEAVGYNDLLVFDPEFNPPVYDDRFLLGLIPYLYDYNRNNEDSDLYKLLPYSDIYTPDPLEELTVWRNRSGTISFRWVILNEDYEIINPSVDPFFDSEIINLQQFGINSVSIEIKQVPEPLTILGVGTAIAFGTSFKRKLAKAKKK